MYDDILDRMNVLYAHVDSRISQNSKKITYKDAGWLENSFTWWIRESSIFWHGRELGGKRLIVAFVNNATSTQYSDFKWYPLANRLAFVLQKVLQKSVWAKVRPKMKNVQRRIWTNDDMIWKTKKSQVF